MRSKEPLVFAALALGLALQTVGCRPHPAGGTSQGTGSVFTRDQLLPEKFADQRSVIKLGSTDIPVEVRKVDNNGALTLTFVTHDEVIESESYAYSATEFALKTAADDSFDPPLPLLKFPIHIGDQWEWTGKVRQNDRGRSASAKVSIVLDAVAKGSPEQAVQSKVNLQIDSGSPAKAQRDLTFWFLPGKGPVRRVFGAGSMRVPAPLSQWPQQQQ